MNRPPRTPGIGLVAPSDRLVGAHRIRYLAAFLLLLAGAEAWVLTRTIALRAGRAAVHVEGASLAHALGLTDLAIWTEARYTRNPALADFFSAFQDHPGAIEHFPAGSIIAPPPHVGPPPALPEGPR